MISVNDLRTGITIEVEGVLYTVIEFLHVKPGKGAAFVRTKLRNLETGSVFERTFRAGERVKRAHIESKEMQYLYASGDEYFFMDQESYEQVALTKDILGDAILFLKDNMEISVQFYQGRAIGVELPSSVELKITQTDPGVRGDTAAGGSKPATLETGLVVQVPLFVGEGEIIKVDTRTKEYLSRA